jgi:hypothetical protein
MAVVDDAAFLRDPGVTPESVEEWALKCPQSIKT